MTNPAQDSLAGWAGPQKMARDSDALPAPIAPDEDSSSEEAKDRGQGWASASAAILSMSALEMPPTLDSDSMQLSVFQRDRHVTLFLTDGRSMQRMVPLQLANEDCWFGNPDATDDTTELVRAGFDEASKAFGQLLNQLKPCPLQLLIPSELDGLPWECLNDGIQRLGDKFAIARNLVSAGEMAVRSSREVMGPFEHIVAIQLEPAESAETQGREPRMPIHRIEWRFGINRDPQAVAAPSSPTEGVALVLYEAYAQHSELARLGAKDDFSLSLIVVCISGPGDALPWARVARRLNIPLVVRIDPEGNRRREWVDGLFSAIGAGCSVAEAVRRLRVASSSGQSQKVELRAYGLANTVLLKPIATHLGADGNRQVTSLSYDLVKSTALVQRVGNETYSEVGERYHAHCASIVRMHGGKAGDPQGNDGVMCYFGFPVAQEDAAERAVRAALALQTAVSDLGLQIRVGVATGQVAVKSGQPWGLSVHLAARLRDAAQPGQVIVSATTRKMLGERFETRCLRQMAQLKDIEEPQDILLVSGETPNLSPPRRGRSAALTPFVGRSEELALLMTHWRRARQGHGGVFLLRGEPGIGKTRLMQEFRRTLQLDGQRVLSCTCRAESQGSAFDALIVCLRWLAGVTQMDTLAIGEEKLARQMPADMSAEGSLARGLIAELVLPTGAGHSTLTGMSGEHRRRQTLEVLLHWFRISATERPLCLIVDDVNWIDPSTREFLDRLAEKADALPLLLLVSQRENVDAEWAFNGAHEMMVLRGLPLASAWDLVRRACGAAVLPDSAVRLLAARGDGVPLFLEESARVALDMGLGDCGEATPLNTYVPETLQDVLMARLDRLGPSRSVAQLASVLGREFPLQLLIAVMDGMWGTLRTEDGLRHLDEVEASGLLIRVEKADGVHVRFKHALVCDTAYQSIWDRDRKSIHAGVADILEARFPEIVQMQPEILARHLSASARRERALVSWEMAARRSAAQSAHKEALQHARAALGELAQLPPSRDRDEVELRLQLLLAARLIALAGYGAAAVETAYLRASELSHELGDERSRAKIELGLEAYYFMRADFERARALAVRIQQATSTKEDPGRHLQANWALANIEFHEGHLESALNLMDQCLLQYQQEQHRSGAVQDPAIMCLCYSAWGYCARGDEVAAMERVDRLLALATSLEHRFSLAEAHGFASSVMLFCHRYEAALNHAEISLQICEEDGYTVWLAHALTMKGRVEAQFGRVDSGLELMQRGSDLWIASGALVTRPFYLAVRAEALLLAQRWDEAIVILDDALALSDKTGEHYHRAEILRLQGVAKLGQPSGRAANVIECAEDLFRAAVDCACAQGRHGFAMRGALDLARLLAGQGRAHEARHLLQLTVDAHPPTWTSRDRQEAEVWLAKHSSSL